MNIKTVNKQFLQDVEEGLSSNPKFLSSRYFYDEAGHNLFVEIMNMPEYYLTNSELEIFQTQSTQLIESFGFSKSTHFELIELGAGDGTKTKELLKELLDQGYNFDYLPIDIAQAALDDLQATLALELPDLSIKPQCGDYFEVLASISFSKKPKVILFLGSNMGNLKDQESHEFLYGLGSHLETGDKILLGLDLIKSKEVVLPAYNDAQQITARFNLNLLRRINRELGGNFDLDGFVHAPEYSENEGIAKSFLKSTLRQSVEIKALDKVFEFKAGEKIHMEISRKYSDEVLGKILDDTDFEISGKFTDAKGYFADYILERK